MFSEAVAEEKAAKQEEKAIFAKAAAKKKAAAEKEAAAEKAAKAAAEARLSAAMEGGDADALERVVRELHELNIVPIEQLRAAAQRHAEMTDYKPL